LRHRKINGVKGASTLKMTAQRKAEIARINGAKSRGPRTEAGKVRSARNATSHGIYSSELILPHESQSDYDALSADLRNRFQPSTPLQMELIDQMTRAKWLILRLQTFQAERLTIPAPSTKDLRAWNTVSRAEARYQRQFHRALIALEAARNIGIEPTPPSQPEEKCEIEPTLFSIAAKIIRAPFAAIHSLCSTTQ